MAAPSIKNASVGILKTLLLLILIVIVVLALLAALLRNFGGETYRNLHLDTSSIHGFVFSFLRDLYLVLADLINGIIKGIKEFLDWAPKHADSSNKQQ